MASLDSFARSPVSFYGFWLATMRGYGEARPHAGYALIKEWCDSLREEISSDVVEEDKERSCVDNGT